jgi:hypothetical protein
MKPSRLEMLTLRDGRCFALRSKCSVALFLLWLAGGAVAAAQVMGTAKPIFTRQAITTALSHETAMFMAPQEARHDWSRLRQLTNQEIVLVAGGLLDRRCRLVSVDDTALTVVDLESPNGGPARLIPRTDVREIKQWIGPRRSRLGAVVGATGGLALGFTAALSLSYKQCGGSCADERILIGASLVGMPIAGGILGYRLFGDSRTLTTIYVNP